MPAGLVTSLARKYGASVSTVEGYWNECKHAIEPSKGPRDGYGIVVNCVKAKLRKRGRKRG